MSAHVVVAAVYDHARGAVVAIRSDGTAFELLEEDSEGPTRWIPIIPEPLAAGPIGGSALVSLLMDAGDMMAARVEAILRESDPTANIPRFGLVDAVRQWRLAVSRIGQAGVAP